MSDGPICTVCGKRATEQDIDGAWWPPCEHSRTHGIHTLFDSTFNCPTHFAEGDPSCPTCQAKQPLRI